MTTQTITVTVMLDGDAREVTLDVNPSGKRADGPWGQIVATIGQGKARYNDSLNLIRLDMMHPTTAADWRGRGFGQSSRFSRIVKDENGVEWAVQLSTNIRNRQARVVGWADTKGVTNLHSNNDVNNPAARGWI